MEQALGEGHPDPRSDVQLRSPLHRWGQCRTHHRETAREREDRLQRRRPPRRPRPLARLTLSLKGRGKLERLLHRRLQPLQPPIYILPQVHADRAAVTLAQAEEITEGLSI